MPDLSDYANVLMQPGPLQPSQPSNQALAQSLLAPFQSTPSYVNPQFVSKEQLEWNRKLAAQLMAPGPVARPMQGAANIVKALVGGNMSFQADQMQQAAGGAADKAAQAYYGGATAPTDNSTPAAPMPYAPTVAPATGAPALPFSQNDVADYIREGAKARNIDPSKPLAIWGGESKLDPAAAGDPNAAGQNTSFGVPQLHYGSPGGGPNSVGGLGDEFTAKTGLDARDPKNWKATVDFSLDKAAQGGWGPWHAAQKLGIGNMDGIGGGAPAAIATAAGGAAVPAGALAYNGQPTPPNAASAAPAAGGMTREQYGAIMASPNLPDSLKEAATKLISPEVLRGPIGEEYQHTRMGNQTSLIHPGFIPGTAGVGGQQLPTGTYGVPGATTTQVLAPGSGVAAVDPKDPLGPWRSYINAGQDAQAQGDQKRQVAHAYADQYQQAIKDAETSRDASYPLRQMQGLIESGKLPDTGKLAPDLLNYRSIANMFGVGDPDTLAAGEELRKQSGLTAQRLAQQLGVHPTDFALNASQGITPGISLSPKANAGLVDNLIRLNDLSQRYAAEKQSYFLSHSGSMEGFQQHWNDGIDKGGAIPLSKFPVQSKAGPDGKMYDKVPSTDRGGFSWVRQGSVQ